MFKKYYKVFYLLGFLAMPVFILLLVYGYVYINQLASEDLHWGHNQAFAFAQAQREGKLILLSVTKKPCEALIGLECGEGKPDLGVYVLLNLSPSQKDFSQLITDDRFLEIKSGSLPRYYLLNTTGEVRYNSAQLPAIEDMQNLPKKE
ncbi:hypothetical protein LPTSP4_33810 [Leptospira ryugenii]|uniref:Uncharacterized protein n=1 Tax=Leptospira ryugenii TaxID=1917863 RepID=A0A2P2E4P1_9LEPT|nr:hypothetical protein [Leptospira ryugenii]GBF51843.1 hypothetical protein LPTSP4_33810 [Leptospira ryugenii]